VGWNNNKEDPILEIIDISIRLGVISIKCFHGKIGLWMPFDVMLFEFLK
jgi:hypothetical protein